MHSSETSGLPEDKQTETKDAMHSSEMNVPAMMNLKGKELEDIDGTSPLALPDSNLPAIVTPKH